MLLWQLGYSYSTAREIYDSKRTESEGARPRTRFGYVAINPWQPVLYLLYTTQCISHLIGLKSRAYVHVLPYRRWRHGNYFPNDVYWERTGSSCLSCQASLPWLVLLVRLSWKCWHIANTAYLKTCQHSTSIYLNNSGSLRSSIYVCYLIKNVSCCCIKCPFERNIWNLISLREGIYQLRLYPISYTTRVCAVLTHFSVWHIHTYSCAHLTTPPITRSILLAP